MTEQHCIDYIAKLNEIYTLCNDNTTTKTILETKINEINAIDALIETDIGTMAIPSTMSHLNKYIEVQYLRKSKELLQQYLYNLVEIRNKHIFELVGNNMITVQDQNIYGTETHNISIYINTIVSACPIMCGRKKIVNCCSAN